MVSAVRNCEHHGFLNWQAYNTDEAAAQGHNGHPSSHGLDQYILDGGERKGQMALEGLEDAKTHETGRHRHHADPAGLEPEIHVGKADDEPDEQSYGNASEREVAAFGQVSDRRRALASVGRHGGHFKRCLARAGAWSDKVEESRVIW